MSVALLLEVVVVVFVVAVSGIGVVVVVLEEDEDDKEAVVPVPFEVKRVGGDGGKSPTSITLGVSNEKLFEPNMAVLVRLVLLVLVLEDRNLSLIYLPY